MEQSCKIPRVVHYGAFGGWRLSYLNESCIAGWKRVLPDYEFRWWDDSNLPDSEFFRQAVATRPINAHNYLKWWALWNIGGVFLDNDVEVLKPFDLDNEVFIGWQRADIPENSVNTAVLGAVPGHPFIKECLDRVEGLGAAYGWPVDLGVGIPTQVLREHGLRGLNEEQVVGGVKVYDKERFYPWRWDEAADCNKVTDRTFAKHLWEGTWK